ncbi:hypothetical protein DCF83_10555 [Edwardsiella tarda]|uniref:hypothetical protein n=1 Tax=Edwardsiella tarda TaxID=636 RepID=UPI000D514E90|nr:hypothetical protein [Edwardsiella tarda]UCQ26514.1 hypothetical protein DCF83_10555 [Edwardsiella tarda]
MLIAWQLAKIIKKNQLDAMRATRANYRHQWQQDLRQAASKFVSQSSCIFMKYSYYSNELETNYHDDFTILLEAQATIELMLDKQKKYTQHVVADMEAVVAALYAEEDITNHINNFLINMRVVLEKAWQDMNRDIIGQE